MIDYSKALAAFERTLKRRNYADNTRKAYVGCVQRFIKEVKREFDLVQRSDIELYIDSMVSRGLAPQSRNTHAAALRAFFEANGRASITQGVQRARVQHHAIEVLSGSEVEKLFEAARSLKHRALFETMYGAGLRVSEACALTIADIDSKRMVLRIPNSKTGGRYAVLSPRLLGTLRRYWKKYRPTGPLLFPGGVSGKKPLTRNAVVRAIKSAAEDAGIEKRVFPHLLRHSFATHLLELHTDLPTLQALLGHARMQSTSVYLHVSSKHISVQRCPIDLLGTVAGRKLG